MDGFNAANVDKRMEILEEPPNLKLVLFVRVALESSYFSLGFAISLLKRCASGDKMYNRLSHSRGIEKHESTLMTIFNEILNYKAFWQLI